MKCYEVYFSQYKKCIKINFKDQNFRTEKQTLYLYDYLSTCMLKARNDGRGKDQFLWRGGLYRGR